MGRVPVVVLVAFFAAFVLTGCESATVDESLPGGETGAALHADATIDTGGLPVLLDLGSDSCVACKTMAPILDELREEFEGRMAVRFIDARKDASAARHHSVKIIPTQIFFDPEGRELFRHQGFFSREDILSKWAELGFMFDDPPAEGA